MEKSNSNSKKGFSRRKFLARTGTGLVGTLALLYFGRSLIRREISGFVAEMEFPTDIDNFDTNMWFEVNDDNTITLKSPKVEMGQGIFTGFAMLAAEELDITLENIKVVHASSLNGIISNTGVSNSTSSLYVIIREIAATLRETLKLAASKLWGVNITTIATKDGVITSGTKSITYAELAKQTTEWIAAELPTLRPASAFKYVGKEQKRFDLLDKVLAKPIYGIDVDLPEMVYGAVLYSPYFNGKIKSIDVSKAQKSAGVLSVVEEKEWVGIVANSRYAAETALSSVKVTWDYIPNYSTNDTEKAVSVGNGTEVNIQKKGDINKIIGEEIVAEFRTPIGFHAGMEPSIVVADYKKDKLTLYASVQNLTFMQSSVSEALGIDTDKIDIIPTYLGGGFGRRAFKHNAVEAAKLSKAVGKPVQLLYTRKQEFQNGYVRPNTQHILKGKLSKNGQILSMQHDLATGPMAFMAMPAAEPLLGADFIVAGHGSRITYDVPNINTTIWQNSLPFETSMWRGVGMFANTFAIETFTDILAHKANIDPLKFRLNHCGDTAQLKRREKLLELLAEKSGWFNPKPTDIGRGIAVCDDHKTISAAVVEVKIEEGYIKVKRVVQAIDPGKVINPEGIRQQVEGATMMAISASLYEKGTIEDSQFVETNFHSYKVVKLSDTPEIEVLIHEGTDKPYGVGESPISPIAPAIANAVFNLTGIRVLSLPQQQVFEKENDENKIDV